MKDQFRRYVPAGSVVLTVLTFGSYGLGLVRDRIFAQTFGLSAELDAYNAAFLLPDFLFNLLVASGISAAVVPLFARMKRQSMAAAYAYLGSVISTSFLAMGLVAVGLFLLAGPASQWVAPGLSPDQQQLTARLIRLLALSPILFALSNSLGAMLVASKRFFFYGLSPLLYNIGIIGGVLAWGDKYGILAAGMGSLMGAGLHAGVRIFDSYRAGWRWRWQRDWHSAEFKKTLRLMVPKMVGHPVEQVTFWIFTAFASTLATGSISALNFARNFQSVPVSLIGITLATTAFPILAEAVARKQSQDYMTALGRVLGSIFIISSLAALALYIIRVPLISVLLGGGSFDDGSVARTAAVLGIFCLAIPTESVSHLLSRAFYARENTLTPVLFSVLALGITTGVAWMLLPTMQLLALPAGFFVGSLFKTGGLLGLTLRYRVT